MPTYNNNGVRTLKDLVFTSGKGAHLFDSRGKKYLDFCSGIAVNILGHADPEWVHAITDQAGKLSHVSNLFHSQPPADLAKLLIENSSFSKVFFCNSGTEANEAAYKFARLVSPEKTKCIAFQGGFHGRTVGSLSLTHKPAIREPFLPLLPGILFARFNDLDHVEQLLTKDTAAIFVEPIQGEGGVIPADKRFLQGLRALCDENDTLLVCDEVQTGLGRTGRMFAHEAYGIQPDLMTLAKPLAGGLPIGAVLTTDKVAESITPGSHGTTFGGNALVARGALVVVQRLIQDGFLPNVRARGRELSQGLLELKAKYPDVVKQVRLPLDQEGLFAGIECSMPVTPMVHDAAEQGLLVISAGDR